MVKFLKFVLLIVVIVFAFALGVKFSDSFKGNIKNDELKVQQEMDKAFRDIENRTERMEAPKVQDNVEPMMGSEQQNMEEAMPEFVDIEVVEPMDNVQTSPNNMTMEQEQQNVNPQVVPNNMEQTNQQQMPEPVAPIQQPVKAPVKK